MRAISSEAIRETQAEHYRRGLAAGAEGALELLIGEGEMATRLPEAVFAGEIPDDIRCWARDAIARSQERRRR